MGRFAQRVAQRKHRAAPEIEYFAAGLINRTYSQYAKAGRGPSRPSPILLESNHLRGRVERIANVRKTPERESAVEEVRDHAPREERRLADHHVPGERGMRDRSAGNRLRQLSVQGEARSVAHNRLMLRRQA